MNKKMTIEQFERLLPGEAFARGEVVDGEEGINVLLTGNMLKWVAVKGWAEDWSVYVHLAENSFEFVEREGDKLVIRENILKLVPCTDEVFTRYRY